MAGQESANVYENSSLKPKLIIQLYSQKRGFSLGASSVRRETLFHLILWRSAGRLVY